MGVRNTLRDYEVADDELGVPLDCMDSYMVDADGTFPLVNPYKFDSYELNAMIETLTKRALNQVGVENLSDASKDDFIDASHYICNGGYGDMEGTFNVEVARRGVHFDFDSIQPLICQKIDFLMKVHAV